MPPRRRLATLFLLLCPAPALAGETRPYPIVHTGQSRCFGATGPGAQRSSPRSGDESRLPKGADPQDDILRIFNTARCVRGGS